MKTLILETDISDHHKLIGTMLRSAFAKITPNTIFYRCNKICDNSKFEETLKQKLLFATNFKSFYTTFTSLVTKFAPLRKKKIH